MLQTYAHLIKNNLQAFLYAYFFYQSYLTVYEL